MSNTQNTVEQLNIEMNVAKDIVAKADALTRLRDNKDFTALITKGYFEEEASRLVLLRAEAAMQDETHQKQIDEGIIAVGQLRQYFRAIYAQASQAESAIREYEDELEAIANGESDLIDDDGE